MVKVVYGKPTHNLIENTSRIHSLSTKLLVSVILWVVGALIVTGYALAFLWQLESGGIAINQAGSLRMRVYHMIVILEQPNNQVQLQQEKEHFSYILNNLKISDSSTLLLSQSPAIDSQILQVSQRWSQQILPLIDQLNQTHQKISSDQLNTIDQFVDNIDKLVKLMETKNTQHIAWLRFIQSTLIIMVVFSAFTAIYLLYRLVIAPLVILQEGITQLSVGNLSKRITLSRKDEFGVVSIGFNEMAKNLEDLYNNLEQKVSEKTAELEKNNHELSSLYSMSSFLHESHSEDVMTKGFLKHIIDISTADAGSIRLLDKTNNRLNYIASQGLPDELFTTPECSSINGCFCGTVATQESNNATAVNLFASNSSLAYCVKKLFAHLIVFHIKHNNNNIGVMTLYYRNTQSTLSPQTTHLIEILTDQLAVALENQQLVLSDRQLAIMEERNLMAQGLHDSIAQSLSFLNLQVQMLQTALTYNETKQIEQTVNFIQQGIQECYEDVRELLLNFRIRLDKQETFKDVVQKLLDRFKAQTKVDVNISRSGNGPSLNQEQQLQVIFILQEALSNIRKHAQCTEVNLNIIYDDYFAMSISDNGCGFEKTEVAKNKTRHVGLSIMSERAAQISATIDISSELNRGTTITLTIPKEQRGVL